MIVGVGITNAGSDQGQMSPMLEQLRDRYGQGPDEMLVDGGFAGLEEIERARGAGCTVFAPPVRPRDPARDPYQPLPGDSPGVAEWRVRMGTAEAKEIYKERAATAECVNALSRNRGLWQFPVRGQLKARAVLLWYALAQNLRRAFALGALARAPA